MSARPIGEIVTRLFWRFSAEMVLAKYANNDRTKAGGKLLQQQTALTIERLTKETKDG